MPDKQTILIGVPSNANTSWIGSSLTKLIEAGEVIILDKINNVEIIEANPGHLIPIKPYALAPMAQVKIKAPEPKNYINGKKLPKKKK